MAKVEGIPLRMIAIIMGSRRSFRSTLAKNIPMKRCPISGKEMTNDGNRVPYKTIQ
jgi:hypothetical protein